MTRYFTPSSSTIFPSCLLPFLPFGAFSSSSSLTFWGASASTCALFEDGIALRDGLVLPVAVDAGDGRVVAGEDLRPARLRVGDALDVDVDERAFRYELCQAGKFPALEALLQVVALAAVPADEDDVLWFLVAGRSRGEERHPENERHDREQQPVLSHFLSS